MMFNCQDFAVKSLGSGSMRLFKMINLCKPNFSYQGWIQNTIPNPRMPIDTIFQ